LKKPNKGFTRTQREWEESIAGHIGRFLDRLTGEDLQNILITAGITYMGWKAYKSFYGVTFGLISYKLATSPNIVSAAAGLLGLGLLGLGFGTTATYTEPRKTEEGGHEIDITNPLTGESIKNVPIYCEKTRFGQFRCFYPGLNWVYTTEPPKFPEGAGWAGVL